MAAFVFSAHIDIIIRGGGKGPVSFSSASSQKSNILSDGAVLKKNLLRDMLPEQHRSPLHKDNRFMLLLRRSDNELAGCFQIHKTGMFADNITFGAVKLLNLLLQIIGRVVVIIIKLGNQRITRFGDAAV
ncbi:hypothetical protein D3C75_1075380 [compost metagenome]